MTYNYVPIELSCVVLFVAITFTVTTIINITIIMQDIFVTTTTTTTTNSGVFTGGAGLCVPSAFALKL